MTIRMLASVAGYALGSIVSPLAGGRGHLRGRRSGWYLASFPRTRTPAATCRAGASWRWVASPPSSPTAARWPPTARSRWAPPLQLTYPQCWLYLPAGAIVGVGWLVLRHHVLDDGGRGVHQTTRPP